jgi:hypothetical protein
MLGCLKIVAAAVMLALAACGGGGSDQASSSFVGQAALPGLAAPNSTLVGGASLVLDWGFGLLPVSWTPC